MAYRGPGRGQTASGLVQRIYKLSRRRRWEICGRIAEAWQWRVVLVERSPSSRPSIPGCWVFVRPPYVRRWQRQIANFEIVGSPLTELASIYVPHPLGAIAIASGPCSMVEGGRGWEIAGHDIGNQLRSAIDDEEVRVLRTGMQSHSKEYRRKLHT